jgi:hypothetical protein
LYKTTDIRADAIISNAVATAIADAERLWQPEKFDGVYPIKGFGIKRLQAVDMVGTDFAGFSHYNSAILSSFSYSVTTAATWESMFSKCTMSDASYVIITGCYNLDANADVEALKIVADGVEYPVFDIREMYSWDVASAYFSHPIIVRPEKVLTVKSKCRNLGTKEFGFLGYAIAKRSYLIQEK